MENISTDYSLLSPEEKKIKLFFEQKKLLDTFLEHHAISKQQYDKSLGCLAEKMGMDKYMEEQK